MLVIFLLGFSSGVPFIMIGNTLKTWMARENIAISTITFFGIASVFYSWKFLWAPLMDRFSLLPIGRRRSWMLVTQILIMLLLGILGVLNPQQDLYVVGLVSVFIGFLSATQDVAVDAYRRESLQDEELGIASSMVQYGFRSAMLLGAGLGIWMVSPETLNLSWGELYWMMALSMLVGIATTLWCEEPDSSLLTPVRSLKEAVVEPFREFLARDGAVAVLLFVFLFKLGDALSGATLNPFYVQMGFTNEQIGLIAKTYGMISVMIGLFLGGWTIFYLGIYRSLWIFGVLQALSTASFALVPWAIESHFWGMADPSNPASLHSWKSVALGMTVLFEDLTSGMGSAAFIAFISKVCNHRYTATQYALLSSLATSGRNIFSVFTGSAVEKMGWESFYISCALIAIPGLVMLFWMKKYQDE